MNVRRFLLKLHLLVGCIAAPFLLVAGLSGAALVLEGPWTDHLNARLTHVEEGSGPTLSLSEMQDSLRRTIPGAEVIGVGFPSATRNTWEVDLVSPANKDGATAFVDPWRGTVVGRDNEVTSPLRWVHDLHTRLMMKDAGRAFVDWASVALVFLSLTGLYLWWPGKIIRIKRDGSARRFVLDLHNMVGGLTWVFMFILGVSGMIVHWERQATALFAAIEGSAFKAAPPPRQIAACAGQPMAPLDLIRANINAAAPGAYATLIRFGVKATDVVDARMKYPEDKTPVGRTLVAAERCTGKVVWVQDARKAPFSYRYVRVWNRSIHTGDVYGWPTRILAALVALLLPVMALTGPLIWWMRRARQPATTG
jgi:uncharacterized iron-regulated membrane protein